MCYNWVVMPLHPIIGKKNKYNKQNKTNKLDDPYT